MAPLAPTVVHARGSAPRRPVTRPFFHGLAPQQHTRLRALGLATLAVAVDAQQAKQRNAGALVQHGARVPDQAWGGVPRLVVLVLGGSGVLAKVPGGVKERAPVGLARARVDGRSYVHAEGWGATPDGRGHLTGTRGLHKDAALASWSPNCTF